MRLVSPNHLYKRVPGLHITRCGTYREWDLAAFPKHILSLLPKGGHKDLLEKGAYDKARLMIQCVEITWPNGYLRTHVLRDYGAWISAVQRAQKYSLELLSPLSVLYTSIEAGEWKLRGITSREFATLASVCARAKSLDAVGILYKLCDTNLLELMLPDLRNSDYVLFLTAMAKSNMIQRLDSKVVRDECLRRLPKMDTFDIAVAVDAMCRLRNHDPDMATSALQRFACVLRHNPVLDKASIRLNSTVRLSSELQVLAKGSPPLRSRYNLTNEIVLLLRALVRADGVDSANLAHIANISSRINVSSEDVLNEEYLENNRALPNWTTVVMSLCYVLAKFGTTSHDCQLIHTTVIGLLSYMCYRVEGRRFSTKDRTKLCLAIYTYWHLAGGTNHCKLLLDMYRCIINPDDVLFQQDLNKRGHDTSVNSDHDSIMDEVEACLAKVPRDGQYIHYMNKVVIPPYQVTLLDTKLCNA